MKNFRTYDLAKKFYEEGRNVKLKGELKDQFERASLSILLNLAEGSGKLGFKDRRRFFLVAYGSARECLAVFHISKLSTRDLDCLCAHIYRLIQNPGNGPFAEAGP